MTTMADPFNLKRFERAQAGVYNKALAEMRSGKKRTHWMWFIFPQPKGLGTSHNAAFYGISGEDEAAAYLAHPLLGGRLREITEAVLACGTSSLSEIFDYPDDLKFLSCMQLFESVQSDYKPLFTAAFKRFSF